VTSRRAQRIWALGVPLALVVLGAAIRLRQYVGGRSLWLDEAFLAESLTTRGPVELVSEPLAYSQSAPLGWLLAVRSVVAVGGTSEQALSEQALRLVPLLCGLAALPLAWAVARQLLPAALTPVAVAVVALSPPLIGYSNELKPYSADVAAVLLVVLVALRTTRGHRLWALTVVGAVVVWFSTVALLAMAAVSVVLVVRALVAEGLPAAVRTALTLAPWTIPGLAVYVLLTSLQKNALLVDYWEPTFPRGVGDLPSWLGRTAQALADEPLRLTTPLLALLLVVVGVVQLGRHRGWCAAVALAVVPAAVLAAAASAYPLAGRLALWLVPLVAVVLAAALPARLTPTTLPWLLGGAVALAVTTGPALRDGLELARERIVLQEVEPVLAELAERLQPGDVVLVDRSARPAFDLYAREIPGLDDDGLLGYREPTPPCEDAEVLAEAGFATRRVWVVFTHQTGSGVSRLSRAETPRRVAAVADLQEVIEEPGAAAYLYTPRADRAPTVTDDASRCLVLDRR
jgi:hypothetical protein